MAMTMASITPTVPTIVGMKEEEEETPLVNRSTALAMASGSNRTTTKHRPTSLRTPLTGTFPSSLSPSTSFTAGGNLPTPTTSTYLKPGDNTLPVPPSATSFGSGGKTPLTPPTAYLDFLRAYSPAMIPSPHSASTNKSFAYSATVKSPLQVPHSANLTGKWTGRDKWPKPFTPASRQQGAPYSASPLQRPGLSDRGISGESSISTMSNLSSDSIMSDDSTDSMSSSASAPVPSTSAKITASSPPTAATTTSTMPAPHTTPTASRSTPSTRQLPTPISSISTASTIRDINTSAPMTTPTKPPTVIRRPSGLIPRPSIIIPPSPSKIPELMTSISDGNPLSSFPTSAASFKDPRSAMDGRSAVESRNLPVWATARTPVTAEAAASPTRTVRVRHVVTRTVTCSRPLGTSSSPSTHATTSTTSASRSTRIEDITSPAIRPTPSSMSVIKPEPAQGDNSDSQTFMPTPASVHAVPKEERPAAQWAAEKDWGRERRERSATPLVGEAPRGKRRKVGA